MVRPTVISTFAGCGGSSLGYHLAGYRELLAVEWDDNAAATFRLNFPDVPLYRGDISKLSVEECLSRAGIKEGELDVFDGSPPCQGFSTAGKRKFDDPRNSLFKEYCRLLQGIQPKAFVMENVTGMIKGYMKQAYLRIVSDLRSCGYQVRGEVLNAMYYGVPQARQRVIIIGIRNDLKKQPSHPKPFSQPISVREAFQGCPRESVPSLTAKYAALVPRIKQGQCADDVEKGAGFQTCVRLFWNKPSPTLPKIIGGIGFGAHLHPSENRVLSIPEMKRLGSFPDDFKFIGKYVEQRARIGNSVPPLLMKAIALHVKGLLIE